MILAFFALAFSSFALATCTRDSQCDCRTSTGYALNCDSSNPLGRCDTSSGLCVYCTDGLDNDFSGIRDCQEPSLCPASRYVSCGAGAYAVCRAGEASYGTASALKWTAGWDCRIAATPIPTPRPTPVPTVTPVPLPPTPTTTYVPQPGPACSISVSPSAVSAGGRIAVTAAYSNMLQQPDFAIINCGNGRFTTAYNCLGNGGSCAAYCYYPYAGTFIASADVGPEGASVSCGTATVSANQPAASCGNGLCESGETQESCPSDCGVPFFCGDGICTNGETSASCPSDCGASIASCSDGTPDGACSQSQPLFCDAGLLRGRASLCGCPQGLMVQGESCASQKICSDGTLAGSCSGSKPYYCNANGMLSKNPLLCGCPQNTIPLENDCVSQASCSLLDVSLDQSRTVAKGAGATYMITLHNKGVAGFPVRLSASSPDAELQFSDSMVNLLPNATANVFLTASTQNTPPGTYPVPLEISTSNCKNNYGLSLQVLTANESSEYEADCCKPLSKFRASISPAAWQFLRPGEQASYNILLQNDNDQSLLANVYYIDNPFAKGTRFSESGVRVDAHSSKAIQATVTVPPETPGSVYDALFAAKLGAPCCTKNIPLPAKISVFAPTASLQILKEPLASCTSVSRDSPKSFEIGIKNSGEARGTFRLSILQPPSAQNAVTPPFKLLELAAGETAYFSISIAPSDSTAEGVYFYTLEADYGQYALLKREYCFQVQPATDLELEAPAEITLSANSTRAFSFKATNAGTSAQNYSLESRPVQGLSVSFEPRAFRLLPRESKTVSLIITARQNADIGTRMIPIIARSYNATRQETFLAEITQPQAPAQVSAAIEIQQVQFKAIEGIPTTVSVRVANRGSQTLPQVKLALQGMPAQWFELDAPRDIAPKSSAEFRIKLNVSQNTAQYYPLAITAASAAEYASANSSLDVSRQKKAIEYAYALAPQTEGDSVKEVILTLTVKNNGNIPAQSIKPSLPTDLEGVVMDAQPSALSLAPGESQQMKISVRPATDEPTASQAIPLKLKSSDGTERVQAVEIPSLTSRRPITGAAAFTDVTLKLAAIIGLLVLIFAVLARSEYPRR
ncbi:MAG: hypothetical protein WC792_02130 [Candidatus Micrarchaeia archaeon]